MYVKYVNWGSSVLTACWAHMQRHSILVRSPTKQKLEHSNLALPKPCDLTKPGAWGKVCKSWWVASWNGLGLLSDTKPAPFWCCAHDKSLESRRMEIAMGTNVQKGLQVLILFIYLPLWIIVSVNQRRLDKGFHAAENSYTATLEGDRQRWLYLSPALISIRGCKLIHFLRVAATEGEL